MIDWSSALHSLAGALVGAGAAISGQLILAANARTALRNTAQIDHQKWARDLAAQAHDGYIVEFEKRSPFYGSLPDPLPEDWLTGLHLKLQRMRLVCSRESVSLAHAAMHQLEKHGQEGTPWQPVQTSFDAYLAAARNDLGLVPHHTATFTERIVHHRAHHDDDADE